MRVCVAATNQPSVRLFCQLLDWVGEIYPDFKAKIKLVSLETSSEKEAVRTLNNLLHHPNNQLSYEETKKLIYFKEICTGRKN